MSETCKFWMLPNVQCGCPRCAPGLPLDHRRYNPGEVGDAPVGMPAHAEMAVHEANFRLGRQS